MLIATITRDGTDQDPVNVRESDISTWLPSLMQDPTVSKVVIRTLDTFNADGQAAYQTWYTNMQDPTLPLWVDLSKKRQAAWCITAQAIGSQWGATH